MRLRGGLAEPRPPIMSTVLGGKIGSGEYGRVQHALLDLGAGRVVHAAVKTFKSKLSDGEVHDTSVERQREIAHLCALPPHPHVLHAIAVYRNTQHWTCVATPLAAGGTVWGALTAPPAARLPPPELVLAWSAQALSALAHMHTHGVLHRDVKLDNLFLDRDGRVVLGDLGLSRHFIAPSGQRGLLRLSHGGGEADNLSTRVCACVLRPPEMFLLQGVARWASYGPEVDAWALGMTLLALAYGGRYVLESRAADATPAETATLRDIFQLCGRPAPGAWPLLDAAASPALGNGFAALPPAVFARPPHCATLRGRADWMRKYGAPSALRAEGGRRDLPDEFWLTIAGLTEVIPSDRASLPSLAASPFWASALAAESSGAACAAAIAGRLSKEKDAKPQLGVPLELDANVVQWGATAPRYGIAEKVMARCRAAARAALLAAVAGIAPSGHVATAAVRFSPAVAAETLARVCGGVHRVAVRVAAPAAAAKPHRTAALREAPHPLPFCTAVDAAHILASALHALVADGAVQLGDAVIARDATVSQCLAVVAADIAATLTAAVVPPFSAWGATLPHAPATLPQLLALRDAAWRATDLGVLYAPRRRAPPLVAATPADLTRVLCDALHADRAAP